MNTVTLLKSFSYLLNVNNQVFVFLNLQSKLLSYSFFILLSGHGHTQFRFVVCSLYSVHNQII